MVGNAEKWGTASEGDALSFQLNSDFHNMFPTFHFLLVSPNETPRVDDEHQNVEIVENYRRKDHCISFLKRQ